MQAQEFSFNQNVSMQGSFSHSQTPFWLNANKHGLSSLTQANGYIDYEATGHKSFEHLTLSGGAQIVAPIGYRSQGYQDHYTSHLIIQEAYTDLTYKNIYLSIGAKERDLTLRDTQLSSGNQTIGINARPVPQIRLGLRDFWHIPGLRNWAAIKGHLSFGLMTDGEWESVFAQGSRMKHNRLTRYHEKAGYLRIGKEGRPFSMTLGLEMATQFGGNVYNFDGTDQIGYTKIPKLEMNCTLSSYFNTLLCKNGGDAGESTFKNNEGNTLGSWVARADWEAQNWSIGVYLDHFFEDHSGMFLIDYNGYGSGDEWNSKKEKKLFIYNPTDFQLGLDLQLKHGTWFQKITLEYLNTTYQSGPVYHDHNKTWPDHISGRDNYYNNYAMPGWQHWGQVMGNPLYLSPQYNNDGTIGSNGNRFRAWHMGVSGQPNSRLSYRMLLSYEKNWGTYWKPFVYPKENTSMLLECTTDILYTWVAQPLFLTVAYGQDWGKLLGNNQGIQITLKYVIL